MIYSTKHSLVKNHLDKGSLEYLLSLQLLFVLMVGMFFAGWIMIHKIHHEKYAWSHHLKTLHGRSDEHLQKDELQNHTVSENGFSLHEILKDAPAFLKNLPTAYKLLLTQRLSKNVTISSRPKSDLTDMNKLHETNKFEDFLDRNLLGSFESTTLITTGDLDEDDNVVTLFSPKRVLWMDAMNAAGYSPFRPLEMVGFEVFGF